MIFQPHIRKASHGMMVAAIGILLPCLIAGCEPIPEESDVESERVVIRYQGRPLADVRVGLHGDRNGPVLSQAITDDNGQAVFRDLPSPEPSPYFVTLESVSDGGWILDSRVIKRSRTKLELPPFSSQLVQEIELPSGSVKPL
ncbi:hypothetical protein LF1_09720 [Rubripirellula obstinata]|uniref:Uncharacterized protein n=1 Tax=Rubripirellula obstinata TaxID=406547 RepID=A0A5B1CE19_9BACT|nr:hypothetical protein [Rubripirellula obstinata]KAA1258452.1 hypothetical protein LF1_09720 [Rubripirellula obstinata]